MITKTITYKQLDGASVTKEYHFNLTKAQIIEFDIETGGIDSLVNREDSKEIYWALKKLVSMSIGYPSEDRKKFIRTEQFTNEFMDGDAYSELLMEFLEDPQKSMDFIIGLCPPTDSVPDKPELTIKQYQKV